MNGKDIHDAMEFVGYDLVDMAENQYFPRPWWHTALAAAAMLAVMLGLGAAALRYVWVPAPVLTTPTEVPVLEATEMPEQDEPETIPEVHPLAAQFPQLDESALADYPEQDWTSFYLNEAGLEDDGTDLYTIQGDQVLAIDAKNGILLIRVRGEEYQGVLAVVNDPMQLSLQASSQLGTAGETVGTIAEAHNGILAVNGSHFIDDNGAGNGGILAGYAMCDGVEYNTEAHFGAGYARLEINSEGRFFLIDSDAPVSINMHNAVEAMPILIQNGAAMVDEDCGFTGIHPRTCIGQTANGTVLILVIEGRMPERSMGTNVIECAEILNRYNCENAINLDGGTSSILWYDGEYVTKCSNQALPEGRPLPNAFVVERAE